MKCKECGQDSLKDFEDFTTVKEDSMIYINGKNQRCECGCNVFRKLLTDPSKYKCNACRAIYSTE